jgi:hypothetical protein
VVQRAVRGASSRRVGLVPRNGGVVVLGAGLTIAAMSNNDIWVHVKTGDLILGDS